MAYTKPYPHRQDAESFDARLIMANPYHRARQYEHQRKAFGLPCAPDENGVEADSFGRDQMPTPQAHQVRYQSCFDGAAGYSHAEADGAAVCKTAPYRQGIREVPVQALTDDVLPPAYSESTASHESLYAFPHPSNAPRPSPSLPGVASPSPSSPPRLSKLIAIPATDATPGSPFLRAYPPALSPFALPPAPFLAFIDALNRASVASPPVQALRLAGNVVGMVPLHTAQVVGGAVNAAATVATIAVSKARVAALLRGANSDVFGPRGLRVGVVGFRDVALLAGMPFVDARGEIDKDAVVLRPFGADDESQGGDHGSTPGITDDDIRTQSVQQRRLRALQPWLSPLDIDDHPAPSSTPSPTTTTSSSSSSSNPLSKMHAAASDRQRRKEEAKLLSSRRKAHDKWTSEQAKLAREHARETQKLDREEGRARGRDSEADLRRVQRRREKVEREYERDLERAERGRGRRDGEEKGLRKLCFLVVTHADGTAGR
ncbi:hypothetical protein PLICBS_005504 [Purpureocillium lilacinum]|uniref:uncharacterized protein n=1 Tax=Purpureocillium lilacinum TaxID=33203 RepID=UPI00207FDA93|nr:hypothetical protein PLICBS_005504 [Purpureocillium lilacinum]